jgi:methylated-DNA-protein-cysteine methyltransferase-like protein
VKRRPAPARVKAGKAPAPKAEAQVARIYDVVRAIPRGKVATYGEIAELAGIASGHRVAARAMRVCPPQLPWQRVVGKKDARRAAINIEDEEHADLQRKLLAAEGVIFDSGGFIPLRKSGWLHAPATGGRKRRSIA